MFITVRESFEFEPKRTSDIINFQGAKFLFGGSITADLEKTRFHRAQLQNVAFVDCIWPRKIYEEIHMKNEGLSFGQLETIYRNLKQNMQAHGEYLRAGEFYYREMECRKKAMREKRFSLDWLKSYVYSFFKYSCGYGERPSRVIGMALIIVILSAFFFQYWGIVMGEYTTEEKIIDYDLNLAFPTWHGVKDYLQCLYYSFVTFTTLGYGDVHPIGHSKIIACAESFAGAFSIALFVLVFGRKMLRQKRVDS